MPNLNFAGSLGQELTKMVNSGIFKNTMSELKCSELSFQTTEEQARETLKEAPFRGLSLQDKVNLMASEPGEVFDPSSFSAEVGPGFIVDRPDMSLLSEADLVPFVFNSPHSGRRYTPRFLYQSRLSPKLLRRSEDAMVDQLFDFVPELGAPLMMATFPRAFVDLNREPFELDPKLFDEVLPLEANQTSRHVAAGLGTIARVVGAGLEIYRRPPSLDEALERIALYYRPYHKRLQMLLDEQKALFQQVVLIDCHSMPSLKRQDKTSPFADIVIGDCHGSSASPLLVEMLVGLFEAEGLTVACNTPYAGGYITSHYGAPEQSVFAVQVEINRALYMDESRLEPHAGFLDLKSQLRRVFGQVLQAFHPKVLSVPTAAE